MTRHLGHATTRAAMKRVTAMTAPIFGFSAAQNMPEVEGILRAAGGDHVPPRVAAAEMIEREQLAREVEGSLVVDPVATTRCGASSVPVLRAA